MNRRHVCDDSRRWDGFTLADDEAAHGPSVQLSAPVQSARPWYHFVHYMYTCARLSAGIMTLVSRIHITLRDEVRTRQYLPTPIHGSLRRVCAVSPKLPSALPTDRGEDNLFTCIIDPPL